MNNTAIQLLRPEEDAIEAIAQLVAAAALRRMKKRCCSDQGKQHRMNRDHDLLPSTKQYHTTTEISTPATTVPLQSGDVV